MISRIYDYDGSTGSTRQSQIRNEPTRTVYCRVVHTVARGPRAQIWAPARLFLGPLGLKYMHWIWAFGPYLKPTNDYYWSSSLYNSTEALRQTTNE